MDQRHLTREELADLVTGTVQRDPLVATLHLLVCPECATRFKVIAGDRGQAWLDRWLGHDWATNREYQSSELVALADRFSVLTSTEVEEVLEAADLASELECLSRQERLLRAANDRRFRSLALGDEFLRRAQSNWGSAPWQAEKQAETAVAVFTGFRLASTRRRPLIEDALARAWASAANARRVQGRLADAAATFERAATHLEEGTGASEEKAWCLRLQVPLASARRDFRQAIKVCRAARQAFRHAGLYKAAAWEEVLEATIEGEAGRLLRAMQLFERFLTRHSAEGVGRQIHWVARYNMSSALAQQGQGAEARAVFDEVISDEEGWKPDPVSQLRVRWTEGLILEAEGQIEEATAVLKEVQQAFAARRLDYDVALVSLDVVRVRLRVGDSAYVRAVASGLQAYFRAKGIHREAAKARQYHADALKA